MRGRLILALLLLAGCSGTAREDPPARTKTAYQRALERIDAAEAARLEANPCLRRVINSFGGGWQSLRLRDCEEFLPAEVMRGVWFRGFEESGFIPNVDSVALHREMSAHSANPEFNIFLDIDDDKAYRRMGVNRCGGTTCAYAITFVGRRTRHAGAYYSGEGNHVVVVDALLSGRLLGRVTTRFDCRDFPPQGSGMPCAPGTEPAAR